MKRYHILPCRSPQALRILTVTLPSAVVGSAYSTVCVATGGVPPYTWTLLAASPNTGSWLALGASTGILSGTPGTAETESVTLGVSDAAGNSASVLASLAVAAGGGAVAGFTPNAALGVTASGTSFADGQSITINVPGGGLGARANPLWLYYWTMESNFSTHPTLSRNSRALTAGLTTVIQSSNKPVNAAGAVSWVPVTAAGGSHQSTAFANAPLVTLAGGALTQTCTFVKRNYNFAANPFNVKPWRVWHTIPVTPDWYIGWNGTEYLGQYEPFPSGLSPTGLANHFTPQPMGLGTWWTDETFLQENTFNVVDGYMNWCRNGIFSFENGARWAPCQTGTGAGPLVQYYADEFSAGGASPNGTTDTAYQGITVIDDSPLQLVVADGAQGNSFNLNTVASGLGVNEKREWQPQTARSDVSLTATLRQGEFSKGPSYKVKAYTGYGTSIVLGTGIWQ